MTTLVLALSGTDHHRFDRLVEWVDTAATRHEDVRFVIQHGVTPPPRVAEGHAFLTHAGLLTLLAEATVVVCHGGPGTIMDAREAGHVPLCVPRDPGLGEHVDGHQQRFAAHVGQTGVVRTVWSREAFHRELESALADPDAGHGLTSNPGRDAARALAAVELESLITLRPHRLGRTHRVPA